MKQVHSLHCIEIMSSCGQAAQTRKRAVVVFSEARIRRCRAAKRPARRADLIALVIVFEEKIKIFGDFEQASFEWKQFRLGLRLS
jgi:hypothetical protein